MIWKICFAMSLIFLAAGAVMFFYKRYHGKGGVRYLGGGVFLSAVSICFPVMHLTEKDGFALAMSISQSIRMFVIDTERRIFWMSCSKMLLGVFTFLIKLSYAYYICLARSLH